MSNFEQDILRMLRVFGPCSNGEVARRLGVPSHKTYRAIYRLEQAGLVVHPKLQRWDLSERGRKMFEDMPNRPLALFTEESIR